jgi:hypothetical protein
MTLMTGNAFHVEEQLKALGGQLDEAAGGWQVPDGQAHAAQALVDTVTYGGLGVWHSRWPRLVTTALLGLGLLAGQADAKKPTPAPPPATSVLTAEEVRCQGIGQMAETLAQYRDKGVPYLTTAAALREIPATTEEIALLTQVSLIMLPGIYEATPLTPKQLRQRAELVCLKTNAAVPLAAGDTR